MLMLWRKAEIDFAYSSGWAGTPPSRGGLFDLPGLDINRTVVTHWARTRGDAIFSIQIRWWLLLLANLPPLLLSLRLAWPMLRRRAVPGRCPVCGYDLRARPIDVPSAAPRWRRRWATRHLFARRWAMPT